MKIKFFAFLTILSTILSLGVSFSFAQEDSLLPSLPAESNPSPAPLPAPEQGTVGESNPSPAPEPAPDIQEIINADINITPQDLGVSDQNVLPDSRLYPIKEGWREIKSFFTFGDVNKAERRLQYANEKLIETKKLAEKTDNAETIKEALDNYKDELAEVKDRVADIKEKAEQNSEVDKFLENFVDGNLKQQRLMDKIENDAPAEVFEKLNEVKNEALNKFSEISSNVAEPERLKEKFEKITGEQKGSDFKEFKNLEILKQIEDKLPEKAKEAIERVQENMMDNFKEKMEKFSDGKIGAFKEYIKNIPGQELKQIEVFHEFENSKMPEAVREIFAETKGLAMKKIETAMMGFGPQGKKEMILKDLEGEKMKDIRIIKELENNLAPETIGKIMEIKNRTLDNIRQKMQDADSPEKQGKIFKEIEKFHDVKQLEMFKEMEKVVPPEKKEFFEKMKEKAKEEMKADFGRAGDEMERKMMFQQMASDNPEGMAIMKEFGPPPEILQEVMKEQIRNLEQKIGNEQDAQKLMILKQRVEEDETVRNELASSNPEIFRKIDDRQMVLNQGMNEETANQQIEKAKAEVERALAEFRGADQTFAQMTPASQLLQAAQKHIASAQGLLAEGKEAQHAWGQATAALHEANSVRKIAKEVDLRKEIGQKRQEEFKQKYEQMMGDQENGASGAGGEFFESGGGQDQISGRNTENNGGKPRLLGPPVEFGEVDMMKCSMPQKPQCPGQASMKQDGQGCPQFFCLDAPNQRQTQEDSSGSSQQFRPQDRQMPNGEQMKKEQNMQYQKEPFRQEMQQNENFMRPRMSQPQTEQFQPKPESSQTQSYPTPEIKQEYIQTPEIKQEYIPKTEQMVPVERIESAAPNQTTQYSPPTTEQFVPTTQQTAPAPIQETAPTYSPTPSPTPSTFQPMRTMFEKMGAGIIMFWDGFLEVIK